MNYSLFINSKFSKFFIATLIGAICVYVVVGNFNWHQIWESLQRANLILFFVGAVTTIPSFFLLRTLRWHLLLKSEDLDVPFINLYLYTAVSIGISNITPFQAGEALKVELLRKYGGRRGSGYTIFFLEKFLDLATAIGLGVLGVSLGLDLGIPQSYFYIFAAVFIAISGAALGILFLIPHERLNLIKILLRERWRHKRVILLAAFLTFCSWMTAVLGWKITLISVSINIGFLQAVSLVSLTMLLAIISLVPGAVGVSEISISTILTKMGVGLSVAQTGAIALRTYALMLLILAFFHWIILKFYQRTYRQSLERLYFSKKLD